ncbi:membrane protein insertion efficiency factor YidD [candidate division Kazan bacterium]|uniref:Putative membrane protein insertion efficiency factor n=1 Tax=candidate division Kazan bacterium TaxID=2202143 RepID=A0A420ZDD8_UNCK3|nr:MAG: membrane protein insertion efficiency factor YidD [candidate division Kazan bacterium]
MKTLFIWLIELYQKTLSPDHGWLSRFYPHGVCRYYPSCSEYTKESIKEWGVAKGIFVGVARICRCHPWAASGLDPVIRKDK